MSQKQPWYVSLRELGGTAKSPRTLLNYSNASRQEEKKKKTSGTQPHRGEKEKNNNLKANKPKRFLELLVSGGPRNIEPYPRAGRSSGKPTLSPRAVLAHSDQTVKEEKQRKEKEDKSPEWYQDYCLWFKKQTTAHRVLLHLTPILTIRKAEVLWSLLGASWRTNTSLVPSSPAFPGTFHAHASCSGPAIAVLSPGRTSFIPSSQPSNHDSTPSSPALLPYYCLSLLPSSLLLANFHHTHPPVTTQQL